MNQKSLDTLEKCIQLLETGAPIDDCINKYPDIAPELQDILEISKAVMNLREEKVPIDGMNKDRVRLLSQANLIVSSRKRNPVDWYSRIILRIRTAFFRLFTIRPFVSRLVIAILITGILIIFSRGLVITSAKSLPGDSLYPLKRAVEDIRVYLIPNREVRQDYEENFSQQRVDEVKRLVNLGRIQTISFEGILESKGDTSWVVSGIPVTLLPETTIVGGMMDSSSFESGLVVEVEGITNSNGGVTANEIHLREYQFIGSVEKINAHAWQISGVHLGITPETQIDDGIRVGDMVDVLIRSEDYGLYALAILREIEPIVTPVIAPTPTAISRVSMDYSSVDEKSMEGVVEKITNNYLVINGEVIYIFGLLDIPSNINIGDTIQVYYKTELNGSLTAIHVEKATLEEQFGETEIQETAAPDEKESQEVVISQPPSSEEDMGTESPEAHETEEPPEEHQENP